MVADHNQDWLKTSCMMNISPKFLSKSMFSQDFISVEVQEKVI